MHGIECTTCHDPHSAGMKVVGSSASDADASALCENCHKDVMKNFPLSQHAQAGVTCVNCHLGFNVKDGNTARWISARFTRLLTMNFFHRWIPATSVIPIKCMLRVRPWRQPPSRLKRRAALLHPIPDAMVTPVQPVTNQAPPVSPVGLAGVAGLMGLAGGMVLAPWLDRAYRRLSNRR